MKISKISAGWYFKKFPCTNPFENSSKTRTSLYLLRFSPDCPKYGRDQIHISIGTHLCENIKRNCPGIFSRNSRVLTPLRIRQKLELHYICYDSVPIAPNMVVTKFIYPYGPIYVKISKETARGNFNEIPVYQPLWEFVKNSNFIISVSIQSRLPQIWS